MNLPRSGPWAEKVRFWIVVVMIVACFVWGGGSRLDIPGLILLQPLVIILTAVLVILPGPIRWTCIRVPLLLLAALAVILAIQLVPLPPSVWQNLPGHEQFVPFLETAGGQASWRPLSVTPDLSLAALVGLCVPAAALIGFASISEDMTHRLLPVLLIAVGLSVILGLGQIFGGPTSGFYRYAVTNFGAAVGFFANRNHNALFLAMAWPMLAVWATRGGHDLQQRRLRQWIAGAAAIGLLPMMAVTGSRAGLALALLSIGFGWWLVRARYGAAERGPGVPRGIRRALPLIGVLGGLTVLAIAFSLSRAEALQRLIATNFWEESRITKLPTLWRIMMDFLPFGAGFGSFDPVFRRYEPDALLDPTYLNHAHNDLLEIVITGGLPALLIVVLFILWALRRAWTIRGRLPGSARERFAFLAFAMITLTLLASLVDYPLRTPLHAMLFAIASGWLAQGGATFGEGQSRSDQPLRAKVSRIERASSPQ